MLRSLDRHLPSDWARSHAYGKDYTTTNISVHAHNYNDLARKVAGLFNGGIERIVRVENPFMYGHFLPKKAEYEAQGNMRVVELFHDTGAFNVDSILRTNLDWRKVNRDKFGKGVSFSPSPTYGNKESSRYNGVNRAMIIADVLVGKTFDSCSSCRLPPRDCDTALGNKEQVYVKFYDNEFYPKYVVYYSNKR